MRTGCSLCFLTGISFCLPAGLSPVWASKWKRTHRAWFCLALHVIELFTDVKSSSESEELLYNIYRLLRALLACKVPALPPPAFLAIPKVTIIGCPRVLNISHWLLGWLWLRYLNMACIKKPNRNLSAWWTVTDHMWNSLSCNCFPLEGNSFLRWPGF